jgi:hypothetical protein
MAENEHERARSEALRKARGGQTRPSRLSHEALQRYLRAAPVASGGSTQGAADRPAKRSRSKAAARAAVLAMAPVPGDVHRRRERVGRRWVEVVEDSVGIEEVREDGGGPKT